MEKGKKKGKGIGDGEGKKKRGATRTIGRSLYDYKRERPIRTNKPRTFRCHSLPKEHQEQCKEQGVSTHNTHCEHVLCRFVSTNAVLSWSSQSSKHNLQCCHVNLPELPAQHAVSKGLDDTLVGKIVSWGKNEKKGKTKKKGATPCISF